MTDEEMKAAIERARETGELPALYIFKGDVIDAEDASNVERYESAVMDVRATIRHLASQHAAVSPLDTPGIETAEAEDLVEQLGDWLNHEAMDGGDPGGKLRDFSGAVTRLLGQIRAVERVIEAARRWRAEDRISVMTGGAAHVKRAKGALFDALDALAPSSKETA
jgi:hypothetical protein